MSAKMTDRPLNRLETQVTFLIYRIELMDLALRGVEHSPDQMEANVSGPLDEVLDLLKKSGVEMEAILAELLNQWKSEKTVLKN
jgi:hypothetical protein